jgi:hypothetical protein
MILGTDCPSPLELRGRFQSTQFTSTNVQTLDEHSRPYGGGSEARAVKEELGDFDPETSAALRVVREYFGSTIRLKELNGIVLSAKYYMKRRHNVELPNLSRNTKRSFALLIKYIETNYAQIVPVFPRLTLLDENKHPLPLIDRELVRMSLPGNASFPH